MLFDKNSIRTIDIFMILAAITVLVGTANVAFAQSNPSWGPTWTKSGELVLPRDYHEWVFLGSPLTPHALNGGKAGFPEYHNVYVQPEAYKAYRDSGKWPEGTILLKELQLTRPAVHSDGSSMEVSGRGFFPAALNGIDISVKDSKKFKNTKDWGFFNFGHHAPPYEKTAAAQSIDSCAGCHMANTDNMVFSKFYKPILQAK